MAKRYFRELMTYHQFCLQEITTRTNFACVKENLSEVSFGFLKIYEIIHIYKEIRDETDIDFNQDKKFGMEESVNIFLWTLDKLE